MSFDQFWIEWPAGPRKVARRQCSEKWRKRQLDAIAETVLYGLRCWKRSAIWAERGGVFIPLPATWINQDRWECVEGLALAPGLAMLEETAAQLEMQQRQREASQAVSPATMDRVVQARQRIFENRLTNGVKRL